MHSDIALRPASVAILLCVIAQSGSAQIKVNPTGVNVNTNGATTAFITFGGLGAFRPIEAGWWGELISASPDIGLKCNPQTIFGRLPLRLDQSRLSGGGGVTYILSIPTCVARRAYQAAEDGQKSSFLYVRRFRNAATGQEQYVAV